MLSPKSVLVFILLDLAITSPARNIDYGYVCLADIVRLCTHRQSPIPGHSADSRQSLEIFDSSYAVIDFQRTMFIDWLIPTAGKRDAFSAHEICARVQIFRRNWSQPG